MNDKFIFISNLLRSTFSCKEINKLRFSSAKFKVSNICEALFLSNYDEHEKFQSSKDYIESNSNHPFYKFLNKFLSDVNIEGLDDLSKFDLNDNMWDVFCPESKKAFQNQKLFQKKITLKRSLRDLKKPNKKIIYPNREILFLSNILITIPQDFNSKNLPYDLKNELMSFQDAKQSYWYDHPIPIDIGDNENEIIYGLINLEKSLLVEINRGNLNPDEKINIVLSLSVTHRGLERIAINYVNRVIKRLNLKFINTFVFDENLCKKILRLIFPKNTHYSKFFGVNGNYGRHYTFLKYALLLWNKYINSEFKYSFKIDLDQIFDQRFLISQFNQSFFEIFKNLEYWGGQGVDFDGNEVDLGMLAGGLINKNITNTYSLKPDVDRPSKNISSKIFSSKRIFCPEWTQYLSTKAEILNRSNTSQRIHVTGGTTGITIDALKKWHPFAPSFINRAEDQSFVISSYSEKKYLSHYHAKNLIMRHDKLDFAKRTVENAKLGKEIGNLERILTYSYYAKSINTNYNKLKEHLWPYTSTFIQKNPEILITLILLIDGLIKDNNYLVDASERLLSTQNFCKTFLKTQFNEEQFFWKEFVARIEKNNISENSILSIINSSKIN